MSSKGFDRSHLIKKSMRLFVLKKFNGTNVEKIIESKKLLF